MGKRILIIDGHPDVRAGRFVHAIADAYAAGAPVRSSVIGSVEAAAMQRRVAWLGRIRKMGRDAR